MNSDHVVLGIVMIVLVGSFVYLVGKSNSSGDELRAVIVGDVIESDNADVLIPIEESVVEEESLEEDDLLEGNFDEKNPIEETSDLLNLLEGTKSIDIERSMFIFEGFSPIRSHVGKFDDWSGSIIFEDDSIVGIEGLIKTESVNTGIGRLDSQLKSGNFFDVDKYGEIKFVSSSIEDDNMKGDLTFLGTTKEIEFSVVLEENSVSADFFIDSSEFGKMSNLANNEVRIAFDFVV